MLKDRVVALCNPGIGRLSLASAVCEPGSQKLIGLPLVSLTPIISPE
jgi:hypothetical protein